MPLNTTIRFGIRLLSLFSDQRREFRDRAFLRFLKTKVKLGGFDFTYATEGPISAHNPASGDGVKILALWVAECGRKSMERDYFQRSNFPNF